MKNDGGPAFPQPNQAHPNNPQPDDGPGMSLRDWFAGQALLGLMSSESEAARVAGIAYHVADAMLKAREGE